MKGISASPGIAIGKVVIKIEDNIVAEKKNIDNREEEVVKLNKAVDTCKAQLSNLYKNLLAKDKDIEAEIFEAHLMILEDVEFLGEIEKRILTQSINAEWAITEVSKENIELFKSMDSDYMKERASDIKDISERLLKTLLGIPIVDFSTLENNMIIVAEDLYPSDTAAIDRNKVLGFITQNGGRTSHSAIMARSLEIPAVVGVKDLISSLKNGDIVAFDGEEGEIFINPSEELICELQKRKEEFEEEKSNLLKLKGTSSTTKDGYEFEVFANIGTTNDLQSVLSNDAEGIGLYRTEFLYMDRNSLPSEEEQLEAYKEVVIKMKDKPVIIRTLDIGGDKELPYIKFEHEDNPFLGYRAIRLCLDRIDIFKIQLRALLRASIFGNIKIMFPMISSMEELKATKKILEQVKTELKNEGILYNEDIEIGMMIEVPSAAIIADLFAEEVDFFSIGTNDLLQYITAVDRVNPNVAHLYNQYHPALLRVVKNVIDNAHKKGIKVGMCGETASNPLLIPLLIGMGLDEFSMSPISVLKSRAIIQSIHKNCVEEIVDEVLQLPSAEEVENYLKNLKKKMLTDEPGLRIKFINYML